jgi:hypothetical protein
MKNPEEYSLQIHPIAICTYISEKSVITKSKMPNALIDPYKNVMVKPQINNMHLNQSILSL